MVADDPENLRKLEQSEKTLEWFWSGEEAPKKVLGWQVLKTSQLQEMAEASRSEPRDEDLVMDGERQSLRTVELIIVTYLCVYICRSFRPR
jgi:hypothetical protein